MSDTDLLDLAVAAHGGQTRWDEISSIKIDLSITGAIWYAKGQPDVLNDVVMNVDTRQQRVLTTFVGHDRQTVFEPAQVVIEGLDGRTEETRKDPEDSFRGQTAETPWDAVQVAYFSGEALWTYLNSPFLLPRSASSPRRSRASGSRTRRGAD